VNVGAPAFLGVGAPTHERGMEMAKKPSSGRHGAKKIRQKGAQASSRKQAARDLNAKLKAQGRNPDGSKNKKPSGK
jgi:hypothetical protein